MAFKILFYVLFIFVTENDSRCQKEILPVNSPVQTSSDLKITNDNAEIAAARFQRMPL